MTETTFPQLADGLEPGLVAPVARASGRRQAPLGNSTKLVHTGPRPHDRMKAKVQRFALQSVARKVLPESRTAKCLRWRAHDKEISVWKSTEFGTAHYTGLLVCGSVWTCPVCGPKIAERRRAELIAGIEVHKAKGGNVHLLTLTVPHQRRDALVELLARQKKALKAFWNDRKVKAILAQMGYIGHVNALEVTHGRKSARNNGWHPHFHILLFTGMGVDLARFSEAQRRKWMAQLYQVWARLCQLAGLGSPSMAHGLRLDDGSKASSYVTKWGMEDEMTRGHTKKGKQGGETPFDLLRALLADENDKQAAALFREFAEAFKGKPQLRWSDGLRARLGIQKASDQELAERAEEESTFLGTITFDQWRDVLKVDARATVLEIAARRSWHEVERFLWFIQGAYNGVKFDPGMLEEVRRLLI